MTRKLFRRSWSSRSGFSTECLEQRALLCGLPHSQLIASPAFDWNLERRVAAQDHTAGGDAVSIIWSNRGAASDGFDSSFGTSAAQGRAVVDAVLAQWSRIITSWNRGDGTTTLQVNISMAAGFGFGAAGGPGNNPGDGKPRTGSVTINQGNNDGNPNSSNGWFFDPTPMDNSEFLGTIRDAYNSTSTSSLGSDFFSVVNSELAHVLGLISDKNNAGGGYQGYPLENFTTATGIRDNAEGGGSFGFFYTFNGATIQHLMTSYNSGDATSASWGNVVHTAGGTGNINFGGTNWRGTDDEGNAIYNGSERTIPSFVVAHILADAYGYSIVDPATFATMHTVLNQSTGTLTIRGGQTATSSDLLVVDVSGSDLFITVDVGEDVPGSGALPGAGNLPAYVTRVPISSVSRIVVNGGGGTDYIRIENNAGKPTTVNGEDGNDFFDFGFYNHNLGFTTGGTTVNGGAGADAVFVYDNAVASAQTYNLNDTRFDRAGWGGFLYASDVEGLTVTTGTGADVVNVPSTFAGQPVFLQSAGGADQVNIGNSTNGMRSILADVQIQNDPSFSNVLLNNGPDTGARNWVVDINGAFGYITSLAPATVYWDNTDINAISLICGSGVDTGNINRLSETLNINNTNGDNIDSITVGASFAGGLQSITQGRAGGLTIDNDPDYTNLTLDDNGDGSARSATLDLVTGYMQLTGLAPATIRFDDVDTNDVSIRSGSAADVISVPRVALAGGTLTLNSVGFATNDVVNIGNPSNGVQSINSPIVVRNTPSYTTLNISDVGDTVARAITINYDVPTDLQSVVGLAPASIFYDPGDLLSTAGASITTGSGVDSINIFGNARQLNLNSAGGFGEIVNIGPVLSKIFADVYVRNNPSTSFVSISDAGNVADSPYTLDAATVGASEFFNRYSGWGASVYTKGADTFGHVSLTAGSGSDSVVVHGNSSPASIDAGPGDDNFYLGDTVAGLRTINPIDAALTLDGGVDSNGLYVEDQDDSTFSTLTVNPSSINGTHTGLITHANISSVQINLAEIGQNLNVNDTAAAYSLSVYGGVSFDVMQVFKTSSAVFIYPSGGFDALSVDPLNSGLGSNVYLPGMGYDLSGIYLGAGAYVSNFGVETSLRARDIAFAGGTYDVADGTLIIDYGGASPAGTVRAALQAGYNAGAWNGTGLLSSTAAVTAGFSVGYGESADLNTVFPATFGAFADVDDTSILIRYTIAGDTNLDRAVNFDDLLKVAQHYSTVTPGQEWTDGDFNYDGFVNFDDLLIIAQQYGNSFTRDWATGQTSARRTFKSRPTVAERTIV